MTIDPRREVFILRLALVALIAFAAMIDVWRARGGRRHSDVARKALAIWAAVPMGFAVFLWFNHANFPLQLETMEGTILQHIMRAAQGLPVYPEPTPQYVSLAYNPLFYYLSVPFTWLFGMNLEAVRITAIVGMAGAGVIIYLAVRSWTGSRWWGWIALGLFACAYRAMDAVLDNAHADSWLLCTALAGTYIVDRARTDRHRVLGLLVLIAAFWFKQHGALFTIGGVLYLTLRTSDTPGVDRNGRARLLLLYWALAVILGPLLYVAAGPWLFGPDFHYFTWTVPRGWSRLNAETVIRVVRFFVFRYGLLALAALAVLAQGLAAARTRASRARRVFRVWHVQLLAAACTAFMGSLDWGSSDNIFIPLGAFIIVVGTVGLAQLLPAQRGLWTHAVQAVGVALAFAPLVYAPQTVVVSATVPAAFADLVGTMRSLPPGPVYAPDLGPDAGTIRLFHPGAIWVALEDIGRGSGHSDADRAQAAALLDSVMNPGGRAYVLTYAPLGEMTPPVNALQKRYTLAQDYGERWSALHTLPRRWVSPYTYPRYLYRYSGPSQPTPPVGVAIER